MKVFKLSDEPIIKSGFTTPDDYFENFSEKISAKLPLKKTQIPSIFNNRKNWYYSVAAILLFLLSIPVYTNYKLDQEELELETLENFIAYHSAISEDEIIDSMEKEDLKKINIGLNVDDKIIENALQSNANLEDYIIN